MIKTPAIILSVLLFAIASFSVAGAPPSVKYQIIREEPNKFLSKDSLDIRLSKKIDESALREIATELRRDRRQYDRLWIAYYLPGMIPGAGAWAITHFTPGLEIQILGSTEEEEKVLDAVTVKADEIIGKWRDDRPMAANAMIIFRVAGKLKIKTTFVDGSTGEQGLVAKKVNGKTRYDYVEYFHGEYFIVESNGNLGMYSSDGKFGEATKTRE